MNQVWVVLKKEVRDNLRDRRTLFFALIYGPVFLPLLIAGSMIAGVKDNFIDFAAVTEVPILGAERAPNLIQYLYQNNIDVTIVPENFKETIKQGELEFVLEIPATYPREFVLGKPAPLHLYFNEGNKSSIKRYRQIKAILEQYKNTMMRQRLSVRGFDHGVLDVVDLVDHDLSSEGFGGQFLGMLLPFIMIMSMVMGGMYLAVDSTAGERERKSLEPLLTLPLPRHTLVAGKYLAIYTFVFISGFLATFNLYLVFAFMSLDELNGMFQFDFVTCMNGFVFALPLTLLIASILCLVSAYTKSTKEAQTHLGIAMMFPMAPFFILQFLNVKSSVWLMALPVMSQYQLLEKVVKSEAISLLHIVLSTTGTLGLALCFFFSAVLLYRRERILD